MKINILHVSTALLFSGIVTAQININQLNTSVAQQLTVTKTTHNHLLKKQLNEEPTQRKCATPLMNAEYETWVQQAIQKQQQFANGKVASVVYNIPVVFHIIHNGQAVGSTRNISQAQVNSQITVLNNDFRKTNADFNTWVTQSSFISKAADCEINFCAAKVSPTGAVLAEPGIDRINSTIKGWTAPPYSGFNNSYIENTVKPGSSWDPNKYFNIWIIEFSETGLLGYAQFPTVPSTSTPTIGDIFGQGGAANTDGVVLNYRYTGTVGSATAPFNKGRTATHEIGHWLGLIHIDGDSPCGSDNVADTPAQSDLSSGCPTTEGAVVNSGCSSSPNPPGRMYQNYMDYTEDKCLTMFTTGQKARMQACMQYCTRRMSLASSTVCVVPTSIEENIANAEVSVFPNPTNGELNISVDVNNPQDFTLSVVNTLGQTIKEMKYNQSNGGIIKFDLSNSPAGVYFVSYKSKLYAKTKRIILQ